MAFLQFTIDIGARNPEPVEEALFNLGALSVTLLDAADDPVLEPAPGAMPLWPTVVVSAMFPADANVADIRMGLRGLPGLDELLIEEKAQIVSVADRAWEREWLKDFRPMRFGRRLWICPGGQRPPPEALAEASSTTGLLAAESEHVPPASDAETPSSGAARSAPVIVELDPGLAFGTGTHATTALCLEWLDSGAGDWLDQADVIDYGCGSGILAISAMKLGARRAIAMDIDPQALLATQQNADRNGVVDRVQTTDDRDVHGAVADVVLANILAGPLVELAPLLALHVKPGGRIALSGLLLEQVESVTVAYQPWFDIGLTGARDGWGLVTGNRRDQNDDRA